MAKFKPDRVEQLMLFPNSIKDYVSEKHLARLIDEVVEQLDTSAIETKYSESGQNTYHPKIMIKLLFYGYAIGERSGRKISLKSETDTAFIYLAQMYKPDFRTINDFRKNNIEELSEYFIKIVRMCKELKLIKVGQINIDGTKIKANAANRRTKTKEEYQEWEKRIDKKIKNILEEADEIDTEEDKLYGNKRGDELPEEINTEEKLKTKIKEVMKKFKDEKEKINLTDSEAKFMKDGNNCINTSYNCQVATTKEQIIVSSEVITDSTDYKALELMVKISDRNLEKSIKEIAADSGYSSYNNYEYLIHNDKIGYIPDQNFRKDLKKNKEPYHQDNFQYKKENDKYICPEGKILGLYKIRRKDYGYRKFQTKVYKAKACLGCSKKSLCTKQKYRTISREDRKELVDQMRRRLQTKEGRKKYIQRMWTTEPIFGHIKFNLGYRQFLLRTLKKVKGEFRLMCIGYNLKKMHKIMTLC
ncbi:MAG: IS1182 family transposase [Candidatus Omnitrophica bacterium]|nr:IS1182 family transposase [Candidatus Omnitrophota bacterium]